MMSGVICLCGDSHHTGAAGVGGLLRPPPDANCREIVTVCDALRAGSMKIGGLLQPLHSVDACRAVLDGMESLGVDSVWSPDHLMGLVHPELWPEVPASAVLPDPDAWLDPFCVMAILGGSSGLPMGTCVTDSTRRRGADLARTAMTLNQSCRGGFILGVGAGEAESILPFGYSFERPVGSLDTRGSLAPG